MGGAVLGGAYIVSAVIGLLVAIWAAFLDVRSRRIPNWMTYSLILFGFCFNVFLAFFSASFVPMWSSLGGFALVGGLFMFVFIVKGCGGGDVKLMAGNGALLGYSLGIYYLLFTLISAVLYFVFLYSLFGLGKVVGSLGGVMKRPTLFHGFECFDLDEEVSEFSSRNLSARDIAIPFAIPALLGYLPILYMVWLS